MGVISAITGFFTGGSNNSDSIIDGVKKAGDMLFYTPEEKAINNKLGMELYIKYQEATLPQNVARRHIAIIIVLLWTLSVVFGIMFSLIGLSLEIKWAIAFSEYVFRTINENINNPFTIIIAFYFLKRIVQK